MTMRDNGAHDIEVSGPDIQVSPSDVRLVTSEDRPVIIQDAAPARRRSRRTVLLVAGVVVLVAAIVVGVGLYAGGRDQVVAEPGGQGPQAPAVPAPLSVTVDAPATVVAGQDARFVVHYADGEGIFSGAREDWGDIGAASGRGSPCDGTAPAPKALASSYVATHAWPAAGTYPVSIAVTTYTCQAGEAVEETATTTMQVRVSAR
ncbi:MAG: hypothetical protein ACXV2I_00195 [Actinomycetes bacterium]